MPQYFALFIEDGEIAVAHLGHDAHDIRHRRDEGELQDVFAGHIIGDGGALADELAGRVGIVGGRHDGDAHFVGDALDGVAHLGAVADDEEGGLLLNGAQLALVPVGQDDDVALFHIAFQHFGGGGADLDVASGADGVLVAHHHGAAAAFRGCSGSRAWLLARTPVSKTSMLAVAMSLTVMMPSRSFSALVMGRVSIFWSRMISHARRRLVAPGMPGISR